MFCADVDVDVDIDADDLLFGVDVLALKRGDMGGGGGGAAAACSALVPSSAAAVDVDAESPSAFLRLLAINLASCGSMV